MSDEPSPLPDDDPAGESPGLRLQAGHTVPKPAYGCWQLLHFLDIFGLCRLPRGAWTPAYGRHSSSLLSCTSGSSTAGSQGHLAP